MPLGAAEADGGGRAGNRIYSCRTFFLKKTYHALSFPTLNFEGEDPKYELLDLDLMRMDSVRSFAEKVLEMEGGVDLLINNAGIMFGPRYFNFEYFFKKNCVKC